MYNTGVCLSIANQQAFLVLGYCVVNVALEPLNHDLEVVIVPFSLFQVRLLLPRPHPPLLLTSVILTALSFDSPLPFSLFSTDYNEPTQGNQGRWRSHLL
jgi:hypothetical protein